MAKRWITPNEAGQQLNVSSRQIYRLLTAGHLVGFRMNGSGSAIRIDQASVDDYITRMIALFQLEEGIYSDAPDIDDTTA